jgi:hypothetical protein
VQYIQIRRATPPTAHSIQYFYKKVGGTGGGGGGGGAGFGGTLIEVINSSVQDPV